MEILLFWLTISLSGIAFLFLSLTGFTHLALGRVRRARAFLRLGLAGVCFLQLVGMHCLYKAGYQTTALWITLTLWLMIAVVSSSLVLLRLGERATETGLSSSPKTDSFGQCLATLESVPGYV